MRCIIKRKRHEIDCPCKCNFSASLYLFLYIFNFFQCATVDELSNTWCREERPFPVFLLNTLTYNFFPQMNFMLSKNINITCTLLWLLYLKDGPRSKAAAKFKEYGPIRVSILFCRLTILLLRFKLIPFNLFIFYYFKWRSVTRNVNLEIAFYLCDWIDIRLFKLSLFESLLQLAPELTKLKSRNWVYISPTLLPGEDRVNGIILLTIQY